MSRSRFPSSRRTLLLVPVVLSLAVPAAATTPETVAPGASHYLPEVQDPCPTFTWTPVAGATYYEIMAFTVPREHRGTGLVDWDRQDAAEVLRTTVAAPGTSWTPGPGECSALAGPHFWVVRAVTTDPDGQLVRSSRWSLPRFFDTSSAHELHAAPSARGVRALLVGNGAHARTRPGG
jgi:hypothetical protein